MQSNEASTSDQSALMQEAIYNFVLQHLTADEEMLDDILDAIRYALPTEEFWVSEFDAIDQAVKVSPSDYELIAKLVRQAVDEVARVMKVWMEDDSMRHAIEVIELDISSVLSADISPLVTTVSGLSKP